MVVCKCKHNAYYPMPDKGCGVISGSRRIRYYRGFLLVSPKQPSALRLWIASDDRISSAHCLQTPGNDDVFLPVVTFMPRDSRSCSSNCCQTRPRELKQ